MLHFPGFPSNLKQNTAWLNWNLNDKIEKNKGETPRNITDFRESILPSGSVLSKCHSIGAGWEEALQNGRAGQEQPGCFLPNIFFVSDRIPYSVHLCTVKKHRMLLITKEMILWQWSTEIAVKVGIHLPGVLPKLPAAGTYFSEPGVFRQCIVSWGGPHSQQLGQKDQGLS